GSTNKRTRPKRSQAQPPKNPPMAMPNRDQLPEAPACALVSPSSSFVLGGVKARIPISAPSHNRTKKQKKKANFQGCFCTGIKLGFEIIAALFTIYILIFVRVKDYEHMGIVTLLRYLRPSKYMSML